jgi:Na+/melibiose symporter-like transporter
MGLANPASNNAAIELAPRQAAEVTGIRGMFRLTGGAFTITTTVLVLSAFSDQAEGLEFMFRVLAVVLLVTSVPLTLMIPDTARERWRREHRTASQSREDAFQGQPS